MGLKFGTLDISAIKVGTSSVLKIYQGSNLVYQPVDVTPPSVPTGLTTDDNIPNFLSWAPSTDNVTPQNEIKYYIERADNASFTINNTIIGDEYLGTSISDNFAPTLVHGNTYYYRIKAVDNALNESAYSTTKVSTVNDSQDIVLGYAFINNSTIACNQSVTDTFYMPPSVSFQTTTTLWSDALRTTPAIDAEYSDGLYHKYWNGSSFSGGDPEGLGYVRPYRLCLAQGAAGRRTP